VIEHIDSLHDTLGGDVRKVVEDLQLDLRSKGWSWSMLANDLLHKKKVLESNSRSGRGLKRPEMGDPHDPHDGEVEEVGGGGPGQGQGQHMGRDHEGLGAPPPPPPPPPGPPPVLPGPPPPPPQAFKPAETGPGTAVGAAPVVGAVIGAVVGPGAGAGVGVAELPPTSFPSTGAGSEPHTAHVVVESI
jgi:hypothetical protein